MEEIVKPNQKAPNLFKNSFLNKLTSTKPSVIITMYVFLSCFLVYYGVREYDLVLFDILMFFIIGIFSWTFTEYILHRFLYHKIKDASYNSGIQYVLHGIHHKYPHDQSKIVLPPVPSVFIATILFTIFYFVLGKYAFAFVPGFLLAYLSYMLIHYLVHTKPIPSSNSFWWKHHNIHHFQQHDRAFGVSTSIWDRVFGTMPEKNRKTISIVIEKKEDS